MTAYLKTHLVYLIIIAIGLLAFHSWLREHDDKLAALQQEKISETKIADLQRSNTQLAAQTAASDAKAAQMVDALKTAVAKVKTPEQAVAALPKVIDLTQFPINARVIPNDPTNVTVAAIPLFQALTDCTETKIELAACSTARTNANTQLANDREIVNQKDDEIAALKQPKKFWSRMLGTAKAVGVGVGIGITICLLK